MTDRTYEATVIFHVAAPNRMEAVKRIAQSLCTRPRALMSWTKYAKQKDARLLKQVKHITFVMKEI